MADCEYNIQTRQHKHVQRFEICTSRGLPACLHGCPAAAVGDHGDGMVSDEESVVRVCSCATVKKGKERDGK